MQFSGSFSVTHPLRLGSSLLTENQEGGSFLFVDQPVSFNIASLFFPLRG